MIHILKPSPEMKSSYLHHTCQSLPFCILWKTPLTALALGNFQDVKVCLHSKSAFVELAQEGFF